MRYTDNLLLKLPDLTDYVSIEDLNENFEKIDEEIATINDPTTGVGAKLTKHLAENNPNAHKAKSIVLDDVAGLFAAANVEEGMKELFTNVSNGKQLVGTAITDVDDSLTVPMNPTFQNLADLIMSISTGAPFASGQIVGEIVQSQNYVISGLGFKPALVVFIYDRSTATDLSSLSTWLKASSGWGWKPVSAISNTFYDIGVRSLGADGFTFSAEASAIKNVKYFAVGYFGYGKEVEYL